MTPLTKPSAKTDFWTVRRRIIGSSALVILVAVGLGACAFSRLSTVRNDAAIVTEQCLSSLALINQLDDSASRLFIAMNQQSSGKNSADTEGARLRLLSDIDAIERLEGQLDTASRSATTQMGAAPITALKAASASFSAASRRFNSLDLARAAERSAFVRDELEPLFARLQSASGAAVKFRLNDGEAAGRRIQTAASLTGAGLLVGLIASVAFMLLSGYVLMRAINQPLTQLIQVFDAMRQGDFTRRITLVRHDEFGVLAEGFNHMAESLNLLVGQVQRSGIQVNASATQIAATSRQQQTTSVEIAATTTQIGATSSEISATSRELVKTMNEVSQVATQTAQLAGSGQTGLSRMEETMRHVMEAAGSVSARLAVLNEKAGNISHVVTTITKVADQTNLLSLNAAIEAEKAGEYGRGFAVVATEIRRLADQTAVSTHDIAQMVKEMQTAVSAGVMGMDKFSEEVRRGSESVHEISRQLGTIIQQVQALTQRFEIVVEGMEEQATGAQQISDGLAQLSDSARETADSLRHSSAAIEQLNEASAHLQNGVSRFRLQSF